MFRQNDREVIWARGGDKYISMPPIQWSCRSGREEHFAEEGWRKRNQRKCWMLNLLIFSRQYLQLLLIYIIKVWLKNQISWRNCASNKTDNSRNGQPLRIILQFTLLIMIGGRFLSTGLAATVINTNCSQQTSITSKRTNSFYWLSEATPYWSAGHGDTILKLAKTYRMLIKISSGRNGLLGSTKWLDHCIYLLRMIYLKMLSTMASVWRKKGMILRMDQKIFGLFSKKRDNGCKRWKQRGISTRRFM